MSGTTLGDYRDPAVVAREHGWVPGTRLVGDEGYGPTVIEITALGVKKMLARALSHNGVDGLKGENSWVLWCRDWQEVDR